MADELLGNALSPPKYVIALDEREAAAQRELEQAREAQLCAFRRRLEALVLGWESMQHYADVLNAEQTAAQAYVVCADSLRQVIEEGGL